MFTLSGLLRRLPPLALLVSSLCVSAGAQSLLHDDFSTDASFSGGGRDTGGGWWYQNTHGAGGAIISGGNLVLNSGGTNPSIRTLFVSQASNFDPFANTLTVAVSGLSIGGDPGSSTASFYAVLGRQEQDDGGSINLNVDEPWEYLPASTWAYGNGASLGVEILKAAGDVYSVLVTDTGLGQSGTVSFAVTGVPTAFAWTINGAANTWSLTLTGATFSDNGTATMSGSFANFTAAGITSGGASVSRFAIGAMDTGVTNTPATATISSVSVDVGSTPPPPANTLFNDDFAADASYSGSGQAAGSNWWFQNTHGAGSATISGGNLLLNSGGANPSIRSLLVSQASNFDPFTNNLVVSVTGLSIGGDPGASTASFYTLIGRQQQDDGGNIDANVDEPWEYLPASTWAYGTGASLGVEILKASGDLYSVLLTDTGAGQSGTVTYALTGAPTAFTWTVNGTAKTWILTLTGAIFRDSGSATMSGSFANFGAAGLTSGGNIVSRLVIGAMNSGLSTTPATASVGGISVTTEAATTPPPAPTGTRILFVGNSFTYGTSTYNNGAITDLNGTGQGGVPAAFKKLASEGGFTNINVSIEAESGQTLTYHYSNKAALIGNAWDYVVLQDHSLRTLPSSKGGDVPAFRLAVQNIRNLVQSYNSSVRVMLYQTWARPDQVPQNYATLQAMQADITAAYAAAAADYSLAGLAPVGQSFMRALADGVAYDPDVGGAAGQFNLWGPDNYHHSNHGCYLAALLFYSKILGGDPRALPTGAGSAAAALGISVTDADTLQNLAYTMAPPPAAPTAIVTQPADVVAGPGGSASFTVTATGENLSYQWRRNGSPLAGATAATLSLSSVQAAQAGLYDVVVTGADASVVSAAATLTVTSRVSSTTWLFDLGADATDFTTISPDSQGRHWNVFAASNAGGALASIVTTTGAAHPTASVSVVTSFSGINQGGPSGDTTDYPGSARRDSFFVTGTGTFGSARKGELQFSGLSTAATYSFKLFGSRSASGSRVARYTLTGKPAVFLETINNASNYATVSGVAPASNGTILLTVEPYNAADTLQEYAYLNIIEVAETSYSPSAYEKWTSGHGLAAATAATAADPDGDGVPNLLEYAFGSDPMTAGASSSATSSVVDVSGSRYLSVSAPKNAAATGLVYTAEVSSDLVTWTGDVTVTVNSGSAFSARDNTPVGVGARRFIRVRVAEAP